MSSEKKEKKVVALNKRARFDYYIGETIEAGLVLQGSEVKSLRQGQGSITESYATEEEGELFLINSFIPEYNEASRFNHNPKRRRKLLVKRRELNRILGAIRRKGITLVPLKLYFNPRGIAKIELGFATGKKQADKRSTEKERDWQRQKGRLLRAKG
ncbi:MAG: SsrA-binding protein [uncultured bacterium]|nr:MAG: SsrA-binding protein [uncultured bacterium]OFW68787.1 MAG: SsrA-binding protein [Alphaproteobacteria bacterium GWC2_42_16]OFW73294.1 MAG: SsrA-binding protein [Alphaproteobacteria bacterium GWA2_41_27]OFW81873.1 MAG: SsrA-binding protein [Alphaproteobacteria bacterium RIFCSPHIGHO2_12_FULL_42_100]OFW84864.1 MAG: SsrA-binding protein [Alphaproteobacteria bacterium RBG_16_42_14]OFW90983.1 MAG: SsrA-binding protein [Alphaproteobacteria bacterium RIFCSPHIGHO2_02_FULL_42_30]OFW91428.1 MAG: 